MSALTGALAGFTPWTPQEDETLRRVYPIALKRRRTNLGLLRRSLPGRSRAAVIDRAQHLGVSVRRPWKPEEDERVRSLWGVSEVTVDDIARELRRTRGAVCMRAFELGLQVGCPEGWEYLSAAAARTGFHVSQLRRILDAAGVELTPAFSRGTRGRGHIVTPEEVDAAIASWMETEPIAVAAERLGTTAITLERRLAAIGLRRPTTGRQHWRVRGEDIERAIARWPLPGRAA